MAGWGGSGNYPNQGYGQQQGQGQQGYSAPGQQAQQASYQPAAQPSMPHGSYSTGQAANASPAPQAAAYGTNSNTGSGYGSTSTTYGVVQQGYSTTQSSFGGHQPVAYGYSAGGQAAVGSGAVAQAAQGLAPEQQAKLSQIVAQVQGGTASQQTYAGYQQPAQGAQPTASYQYGSNVAQQTASYNPPQSNTTQYNSAQQQTQSPYTAQQYTSEAQQQGYGTGGYAAQQGAAAASYGNVQPASGYASAQQAPTYTAPQPQQQPTAAGYGTAPSAGAGGYGTQQTTPALAGQSNVGQAQYGTLASPGPTQGYTSQQTSAATTYGQPPDARSSYTATQQTSAAPQAAYGRQGTARSYTQQAGQQQYGSSYGSLSAPTGAAAPYVQPTAAQPAPYSTAGQQGQYKAAAPAATGYGTPAYTPPSSQGRGSAVRPTAASSSQPTYGRPVVQAPMSAARPASVRPPGQTQRPAAGRGTATPAGGRGRGGGGFSSSPRPYGSAQTGPAARSMAPANAQAQRAAAAAQVGQSAREISRMADAAREKRDEAKARERERERPRETRITAAAERPRGRDRERDSEVKEREMVRSRSRLASPPRRSPPRRPSPARRKEPEYSVRLSSRPVVTLERDYQEVIHRHARLYVSADFSKVVSKWVKAQPIDTSSKKSPVWRLLEPVQFQHEVDFEESPKPDAKPYRPPDGAFKWSARVVLLAGLDEDARKELMKGVHHGGQHLHQLLKFLTVRTETDKDDGRVERSGITAIGGPHDPALDGPIVDPSRSTKPLIATCVRHAKDLLGVDLSACKEWLPMVEVHYQRPPSSSSPDAMESTEVSVIFLANVRSAMPEKWQAQWKEQEAWLKRKGAHEEAVVKKEEEEENARKAKAQEDKPKDVEATKASEEAVAKDGEADGGEKPAKRAKTGDGEKEEKKDREETTDVDMKDAEKQDKKAPKEAEVESKLPDYPRVLFRGKRFAKERWRSASISLDGLLDYDEEDRDESTLELSLFAEGFQDMLARDYGERILKSLYAERSAALKRREERKRKREEEKAAAEAKAKAPTEAKLAEAEPAPVKLEEGKDIAPLKEEPEAAGAEPEPASVKEAADVEMKQAPVEEPVAAAVKAENVGEKGEEADAPQNKEEQEKEEEDTTLKKAAGRGKKAKATRGRGRGRAARGRSRKAQTKAEEDAEEEEMAEPGEEAGKDEADGRAEQEGAALSSGPATEEEAVKEEGGAPEQAGQKAADEKEPAAETPTKESVGEQAKDTKPADCVPVENGSAKVEKQEESKPAEKDKEKKKKKYMVDDELLLAFRYFDRNCCGYIKVDDLRRIVNNLGHALSLRTVKELCLNVAGAPASVGGRARLDTRVYYRDITDKEVPEAA